MLALAAVALLPPNTARAQATPAATPATAPATSPQTDAAPSTHGTVLFERHADPAADASQQADPAPATPPAPGTSSSIRRRHASPGLQTRKPTGDATPAAPASTDAPPVHASSTETTVPGAEAAEASTHDDFPLVSAAERAAPQLLDTDLDLHLDLRTGDTSARAKLRVRNSSAGPLQSLLLQISGSLQWQAVRLVASDGTSTALPLRQHLLPTDADHTGAASEVLLTLAQPLAPGATLSLDAFYTGKLGSSAERLIRLGAPADRAALTDWDTISDTFVGLRGFGNVLWMPAAAPVVSLGSPADFAAAVDEQRRRHMEAHASLRLTIETDGPPPRTAFFMGMPQPLAAVGAQPTPASSSSHGATSSSSTSSSSSEVSSSSSDAPSTGDQEDGGAEQASRLYTAAWPAATPESQLPSLFITAAANLDEAASPVQISTDRTDVAEAYDAAAARVQPLLQEWLGPRPARPLRIVDLPLQGAQPFAAGDLLVAPLHAQDAKLLAPSLVYPMSSAWLPASLAPWLSEGLPEFLRLLYTERTEGRDSALVDLAASGDALARNEALPAQDAPALTACVDATCARTKSAYVFSMLRQIAGEDALKQALTGWLGSRDAHTGSDATTIERLLETASGKKLDWFFADWVNRDAGLPDLVIVNVAPRQIERGTVFNNVPSQRRPVGGPIGDLPEPKPGDPTQPEQGTTASRNQIGPRDGSWLIAVEVQNNGGAVAEVPVTVRSGGLQNTLPLRIAADGRATIRVPFETAPDEVWVNDGATPEQRSNTHHRTLDGATGVR